MIDSFQRIDNPNNNYPELELYYSTTVQSEVEGFRENIRQFLWKGLEKKGLDSKERFNILNLNKIPTQAAPYFFNISHSKIGSFLAISKGRKVGVDIEDINRISTGLVNRISPLEEQSLPPDPKLLFSAKESCWKACEKQWTIATISQIGTHHWESNEKGWHKFSAHYQESPLPGEGWIYVISGTCLSFFICP